MYTLFLFLTLGICSVKQCDHIAGWLEYTSMTFTHTEGKCIADHGTHTVFMELEDCQDSASRTCFECKRKPLFRGCGKFECGGPTAGICLQGRCECYPGYVLSDERVCEVSH